MEEDTVPDAGNGWVMSWSTSDSHGHSVSTDPETSTHTSSLLALRRRFSILRWLRLIGLSPWLSDPALRQRSHAGLNKGETSNALRRAVFFHRQGEFRDRTFENQSFRASGLSLLTAAIVHWNTIYLDQAVQQLRVQGVSVPDELLAHVAPLGWEHIALTADYDWNTAKPVQALRPLRAVPEAFTRRAA
jgi:hypothetical protein